MLKVRSSWRVTGVAGVSCTLHLWQVPWPPHVESIAMPFHDAESKTVTPGGTRTFFWAGGASLSSTVKDRSTRPVPSCSTAPAPEVAISPSRRSASGSNSSTGSSAGSLTPSRRALARWAAIQAMPQSSWLRKTSAAFTDSTICGVRVSMIALVRPAVIAIGSHAAPRVCRSGMPKETLEAPHVMFRPCWSRICRMASMVTSELPVSAPIGMASGSITMSALAMPYSSVATRTILPTRSRRFSHSIGISSWSLGSAITAASYFLTRGRIAAIRSSSAVIELTSARPW